MKCWRTHSSGVSVTYDLRNMSKIRGLPSSVIIFVLYEGRFNLNILYLCSGVRTNAGFIYWVCLLLC